MYLARNTYIWPFIAVLLGSTFAQPGQPLSENALHDGSPNTLRRRSGEDPPPPRFARFAKYAQMPYERLRGMYRSQKGMPFEDYRDMHHWYDWINICAVLEQQVTLGGRADFDDHVEWCSGKYWELFKETGEKPKWPTKSIRPQRSLLEDRPNTPTPQQPPRTLRQKLTDGWRNAVDKMKGYFSFEQTAPGASPVGPVPRYRVPLAP